MVNCVTCPFAILLFILWIIAHLSVLTHTKILDKKSNFRCLWSLLKCTRMQQRACKTSNFPVGGFALACWDCEHPKLKAPQFWKILGRTLLTLSENKASCTWFKNYSKIKWDDIKLFPIFVPSIISSCSLSLHPNSL